MKSQIEVSLNKDESLVLFEFLSRFSNEETLTIKDQAEERVLWNLYCNLEKLLVEHLQDDYREKLVEAQNKVRDKK